VPGRSRRADIRYRSFVGIPPVAEHAPLPTSALHADFGVEVHGVDLRRVTASLGYPTIRSLFEEHSLLLFRDQRLDDDAHLAFGSLFGPIEDRSMGANGPAARLDNVSNLLADGTIAAADSLLTLDLTGNQRWHTDSTFLPVPALANVLAARVLSSSGGETEFASTRAAWAAMPDRLRDAVRDAVVRHRVAHSRAGISDELVERCLARWPDQLWRAVWPNPINGREALYIASHAMGIEGLSPDEAQPLITELIEFCTRPQRVYTHRWRSGDVLVWDERAMLHRGRPWPYDEERTLASICVSARDVDGLDAVTPG
jgi:alpha-ketoglutarate-dependent 2,4-dichlorophenoxyacetate dioxygenase